MVRSARRRWSRALFAAASLTVVALASACASGGNSTSATADTAAAGSFVAPYVGHPAPFPIDTPLKTKSGGKTVAFMDCGTPTCGLYWKLLQPAAADLGIKLVRFNAGVAADSVNTAFNSAIESNIDGAYVTSIPFPLWQRQAARLAAAHIPIATSGVIGTDNSVAVKMQGEKASERQGQVIAAYAVAQSGDKTDAVFYSTPELAFEPIMAKAFLAKMKELCPNCSARTVDIPSAQLATNASATIIADLQAHPKTQTAIMGLAPQSYGLAQALGVAGLKINTYVNFPDPQALQDIKSNKLDAGVALDTGIMGWTMMDSLARLMTGEPVAPGAAADATPTQILTSKDLQNVDVSVGYQAYPDYQQRFQKLWAQAS
jgi:ribose transport system substrate-binding protein